MRDGVVAGELSVRLGVRNIYGEYLATGPKSVHKICCQRNRRLKDGGDSEAGQIQDTM